MDSLSRRAFLAGSAAIAAAGGATAAAAAGLVSPNPRSPIQPGAHAPGGPGDAHRGIAVISSGNGAPATLRAMERLRAGDDPVDAVVAGVNLVEDDPDDMTVGLGGLPNEDGVVELDSSVMHGPTHKAGAVASLRNIRNPSSVALKVLKRTDHVLIVGEGALRFARAHGFTEENLLTDKARRAWLEWKENLSPTDDWLDDDQRDWPPTAPASPPRGELDGRGVKWEDRAEALRHGLGHIPFTYGTINCLAATDAGDLGGVTTTSGLSYKIPGRVGDSPIIGAGLYVDNTVGGAGATGRGEAVIQNAGAFSVVERMREGRTPTEACVEVLKRIADRTREKRLLDAKGRPDFNVVLYAMRKDGAFGSASMWAGVRFAANDGEKNGLHDAAFLFERERR